jgi:hypothetical protein
VKKKKKNILEIPEVFGGGKIDLDHAEEEHIKINQTSSQKKMWNYLEDLVLTPEFRKDLKVFRKKFKIAEKGYDELVFITMPANGHKVLTYPHHSEVEARKGYRDALLQFAKKYGLDLFWADVLECYIFYNKFVIDTMSSMISVEDIGELYRGQFPYPGEAEGNKKIIETMSENFPVAIMLNPYVSQRDIIDYVKKTYKVSILPKLLWYRNNKIRLGTARRKNSRVKARNKFIFDNRNKSKKEIVRLVAEKFGEYLDYTYIARIIKEEEGHRK